MPGLPAAGRPGAVLHIYVEYGTVLPVTMKYVYYVIYDVCSASNSFVQYSVCVCGIM